MFIKDIQRGQYTNVCGIYKLYFDNDDRFYIGSTNDLQERLQAHTRAINKQKHFESYTIPPMQNKNNINSSKELELRQTLNDWMLEAFMFTNKENQKKLITEKFNKVQSAVLDSCLRTDENMLVSFTTLLSL